MNVVCIVECLYSAQSYKANQTVRELELFHYKIFYYPACCTDIIPSDYFIFLHLKLWRVSHKSDNDDKLKNGVPNWLKSHVTEFS